MIEEFDGAESDIVPERRLWSRILRTYFVDLARFKKRLRSEKAKTLEFREETEHAITLLFQAAHSSWSVSICDYASVDHDFFIRKLNEALLDPDFDKKIIMD